MGCFLKPSSPTSPGIFSATIQPPPWPGAVIGHEIGPRLVQMEAHAVGIDDLHLPHFSCRMGDLLALEG